MADAWVMVVIGRSVEPRVISLPMSSRFAPLTLMLQARLTF